MAGRIESGQLCTVTPVAPADLSSGVTVLRKDDIVLCKVNGAHYLHMVVAVNGSRYLIGNNRGHQNGWIGPNGVFGICTRVEK